MQEIPDNELDNLFRKSAEEYTPEFDPEAWRRMKKKLDESENRGGAWWRTLLLCLVGGLLVSIWTGYKLTTDKTKNNLEQASLDTHQLAIGRTEIEQKNREKVKQQQPKEKTDVREAKSGDPIHTLADQLPGTESNSGSNDNAGKSKAVAPSKDNSPPTEQPKIGTKRREGSVNVNPENLVTAGNQKQCTKRKPKTAETAKTTDIPVASVEATIGNTEEKEAVTDTAEPVVAVEPTSRVEAETGQRLDEFVLLVPKPIRVNYPDVHLPAIPEPTPVSQERSKEIQPQKVAQSRSRLGIRAVLSPDLSSVGLFHLEMPGTNVGLLVEYRLWSRIQVQTGVIHSIKRYSATPENYSPTYWKYMKVKPTAIDGVCKMVDLPLNIRYNVLQGIRHNLFVSGGITSYIMLSEKYNYQYAIQDPNLRKSWSGKRSGEHYFSVANFSLGYERQFLPGFTWQVEPFVKVPLGRVGYGKVKLISTGVFLSAKYQFSFNKSHFYRRK